MLQTLASLIVVGAAFIQIAGFAALHRYFADFSILDSLTLSTLGATADWGYQVVIATPNIIIAMSLLAYLALARHLARWFNILPFELIFVSDKGSEPTSSWLVRFNWSRYFLTWAPVGFAAVIAASVFSLVVSAEAYGDKIATQVLLTGSRAQLLPHITPTEYVNLSVLSSDKLPKDISHANGSNHLALLWSDERVVIVTIKRRANDGSGVVQTETFNPASIAAIKTFRRLQRQGGDKASNEKPRNGVAVGSLLFAFSMLVFATVVLVRSYLAAKRREKLMLNLTSLPAGQNLYLRLRREDADAVFSAFSQKRDVVLSYFERAIPTDRSIWAKLSRPIVLKRRLYLPASFSGNGLEVNR